MKIRFGVLIFVMMVFLILMTQCSPATTVVPVKTSGPSDTAVPANTSAPTNQVSNLDGKALAEKACSTCHGYNKVSNSRGTAAQWKNMVQKMVQLGAVLNSNEEQAVTDYLAKTYPK